MAVQLQHKDGRQVASQITVHYDGKIRNLEINENGKVKVENRQEAQELIESHGRFKKISEDKPDHVLSGKTVDEVKQYIRNVEDVERLKELRELEDRKTGKEAIDNRIEEVKSKQPVDVEAEKVQKERAGDQDGSQDEK